MQVHNLHCLGPGLSHFFHQQPNLDNLAGAHGVGLFAGGALVEGDRGVECAPLKRQAGPRQIHQHAAHGASRDRVEMFAASNLPTALVKMAEPDFVD
jgi:hypothetical protein